MVVEDQVMWSVPDGKKKTKIYHVEHEQTWVDDVGLGWKQLHNLFKIWIDFMSFDRFGPAMEKLCV